MCPDSIPWWLLISAFVAGILFFFGILKLFGPRGLLIALLLAAAVAIPLAVNIQQTLAACK